MPASHVSLTVIGVTLTTLDAPLPVPDVSLPALIATQTATSASAPGIDGTLTMTDVAVNQVLAPVCVNLAAVATVLATEIGGVADPPPLAYTLRVWFIETPVFSSQLYALLSDDDFSALQLALALRPEQGTLIPGGGGLRKLRWGHRGRGKRGGLRVIYYWDPAEDGIYLLFLYPKNRQEDLTPEQLKLLRRIVQEDLK